MKILLSVYLMAFSFLAPIQKPLGVWKTVDDVTGEAKSYVEIYEKNGKLFGKITKILIDEDDALCIECSGDKKDQLVLGMVIIEDMELDDDRWEGGEILDPETGKTYDCELWIEEGNLKVKGIHWTGFSRTQTWYAVR